MVAIGHGWQLLVTHIYYVPTLLVYRLMHSQRKQWSGCWLSFQCLGKHMVCFMPDSQRQALLHCALYPLSQLSSTSFTGWSCRCQTMTATSVLLTRLHMEFLLRWHFELLTKLHLKTAQISQFANENFTLTGKQPSANHSSHLLATLLKHTITKTNTTYPQNYGVICTLLFTPVLVLYTLYLLKHK